MGAAEDLMQRLAVSKKIMERSEQIKSTDSRKINMPMVEEFSPINASYNLPSEFLPEQTQNQSSFDPTQPLEESRILKSKLPDEIKRLMIDQPIVQPSSVAGGVNISEEVIQGAQRLMNMNQSKISEQPTKILPETLLETPQQNKKSDNLNISVNEIKSMIRDVVRDTVRDVVREELKDAGMLVESTQNTNDVIQFKVGQHLFIGKVTKIKKLEK
jgi:hypothetical protein